MKKILFAVLISAFAFAANAAQCNRPGQEGCWDLLVLNAKWNQGLNDLDKAPASQEARQERINTLGPRLMAGYQQKKVEAAKPRSFLVVVWKAGKGTPVSYKVNGRKAEGGKVTQGRIENVTGKVTVPTMDKVAKLGAPKVYRIYAEGPEAIGASFQASWEFFQNAVILVRTEDDLTVYPHDDTETNEGLWIRQNALAVLRQNNVVGSIAPIISKE